jgi:hypothetical protein
MNQERRQKELEKALRISRRALPFQTVVGLVFLAAIWGLHVWLRFPAWIAWVASVLAIFGAVSDAINILYCRRALRRFGSTAADA